MRKALWLTIALAPAATAAEHPFILWTKDDLAALKRKIETREWAKRGFAELRSEPDPDERWLADLLRYRLLGDKEAAERQKRELLAVMRSPVPRGGAQWITILRYDLLYDLLTDEEKRAFAEMARVHIRNAIFENAVFNPRVFNDSRRYSRYDARRYTRTNWLPNIIWPRKVSANLFAAAIGERDLIEKTWAAYGSWKWYFDEYLCDVGFYSEEFSKMGSTPGAMILYCLALEHLGLDRLGFGYRGKGGATMRGHLESIVHLGYPRVDICSARPHYPMVTMGDLRQVGSSRHTSLPSPAFQHSIVEGYLPDGTGGDIRWMRHGAWSGTRRGRSPQWDLDKTPKMQLPLWFEFGHKRWPEARFGYFLVQMRLPDQDRYYPSFLFGLDPLGPEDVEPPPAPSAVWPERGIAMLRAEESPAYWKSPAPAVAMRLASDYAHHVNDPFALLGFYALNRPIYLNRQVTPGYAEGWSRSIQSHCGVSVDGQEPRFTSATSVRKRFAPLVKFVAARSREVFPGCELTRSLMLAREYLLDFTRLASEQEHDYYWFLHTLGVAELDGRWKPGKLPGKLHQVEQAKRLGAGDDDWSVRAIQSCGLGDPGKARLPKAWYDRRVGVRMKMLGAPGTTAFAARTPLPLRKYRGPDKKWHFEEEPSEVGGVTIIASRRARLTLFAALHEPFDRDRPSQVADFRRLAQTADAVVVPIVGKKGSGINDRAMVAFGDAAGSPRTIKAGGEEFTFSDFAFIRIGRERVEAVGPVFALRLKVEGEPALVINGERQSARAAGGWLEFKKGKHGE